MNKRNPNHGLGRLTQEDLCKATHPSMKNINFLTIIRHDNPKAIEMRGLVVGIDGLGRVMWFNPMKCCDESLDPDQYVILEGE